MRKMILAAVAAATLVPTFAGAQSYGEVRRDQREIRESRRDLQDARRELREDRQERREDWRDYRRTHGNVYRRPAYVGPRGYRYRPVNVGYQFAPNYYGRQYWINDYQTYRLARPAYGYQRWVRYGRDVVLVDTRNGRVAQVNNGFFY